MNRVVPGVLAVHHPPPCGAGQGRPVLMDARDRGIDQGNPIQLTGLLGHRLSALEHTLPHALINPPVEIFIGRVSAPEPLGQVLLRSTGTEPPMRWPQRPCADQLQGGPWASDSVIVGQPQPIPRRS